MQNPAWKELEEAVKQEMLASSSNGHLAGPPFRRLLANHVSVCCQPGHSGGVVESLEVRSHYPVSASGLTCEFRLPNLIPGMNPRTSAWVVTAEGEQAEEECYRLTFLFCIVVAPSVVRLHPSTLNDPERIRRIGWKLHTAALEKAASAPGSMPWVEASAKQALGSMLGNAAAPTSGASGRGKKLRVPKYQPPANATEAEKQEAEVMNSLLQLSRNTPYDPSRLPHEVLVVLAANLRRHGLKPFLQRHPDHFTIVPGTGKSWQFIVHGVSSTSASGAAPSTLASGAAPYTSTSGAGSSCAGSSQMDASGAATSTSASGTGSSGVSPIWWEQAD